MKFTDPIERSEFTCIKEWVRRDEQRPVNNSGYYEVHKNSPLYRAIGWLVDYVERAPIMPEQPDDALLNAMSTARPDMTSKNYPYNKGKYNALRAALCTPPKPKTKTVWCFTYRSVKYNPGKIEMMVRDTREELEPIRESAYRDTRLHSHVSPIWSQEVEDK